jgi:hypothetical protein
MNKNFGIIYIATGPEFIEEAAQSAASVRTTMPGVQTAIFLDPQSRPPSGLFDHVTILENPSFSFLDKIEPLAKTPFEKTLFLDTDTLVIEPVYELALLLDRFDLAYCHGPWRNSGYGIPECPEAFPEPNTGVLLYRRSDEVFSVFRAWVDIYKGQLSKIPRPIHDQPALRKAVYESGLNFTILPPEYNFRTVYPYFAGGNLKVKILHGRGNSLKKASLSINKKPTTIRIGNYNLIEWNRNRLENKYKRSVKQLMKFRLTTLVPKLKR